jgi:thiamine biosynthesis lipoprotein
MASCAARQFRALGTVALVATVGGEGIDVAEEVLRRDLEAIDRTCSRFRADSELVRAGHAHGRPVRVSPLLAEAVTAALMAAEMTDGAVDPTVGAAVIDLGYDRDFDLLGAQSARSLPPSRPAPGWRCIDFDPWDRLLRAPAGVVLDLGATAKALAADRAAAHIAEATGAPVLVNLGGDIAVAGSPPDGWAVGIALDCATSPSSSDAVVALRQGGLASSGTAVRTWRRGARRLHHIVDPRTGDSARTCWQLVSVAAPSCVVANAASTAAIVWSEDAPRRLAAMGLPCRLVGADGSVLALNGWPPDRRGADRGQVGLDGRPYGTGV